MATQKIDVIVVGQGVAGTWLSYYLMEAGLSVLVVDDFAPQSASRIASGIINPITGHKHVKTWLADSVLPFAASAYTALSDKLGVSCCSTRELIWLLDSTKAVNDFSVLSVREGYDSFMGNVGIGTYCSGLQSFSGYGTVHVTYVDMSVFLSSYRHYLADKGLLLAEKIDYSDIIMLRSGVKWKDWEGRWMLFCEGYAAALSNPFFAGLPFVPAKGEVLLTEIIGLELGNALLKSGIFVLPTNTENIFWVGSNYEHNFSDSLPNEATRRYLLEQLEGIINLPYKVLDHWASIRPASRDRRPFVGLHPHYSCLGVFNGMGTKGVSLSPFFAHQFVAHLTHGVDLFREVSVKRINTL